MSIETPLRAEHERAGATLAEYFGCVLPERYANFDSEYQMARECVALVDKCYRAFF